MIMANAMNGSQWLIYNNVLNIEWHDDSNIKTSKHYISVFFFCSIHGFGNEKISKCMQS
jgi:hypothetical protein